MAAVLIAGAGSGDPACQAQLARLRLPALQALLAEQPFEHSVLPDDAPDTPLECAHAAALGLPVTPQGIPWGAWHAAHAGIASTGGEPWAVVTPCHWAIGTAQVTLTDPAALALTRGEADALAATMAPYFAEDGLGLQVIEPGLWLAQGAPLRGLATASVLRAQGMDLRDGLPANPLLRRLQTEMQMLLYHHPVNAEREARGQQPVNAVWFSGAGTLDATPVAGDRSAPVLVHDLDDSAARGDWPAWAAAWQRVDAEHCAPLLQARRRGVPAALVLCGTRASAKLSTDGRRGLWSRLSAGWRPPSAARLLGSL